MRLLVTRPEPEATALKAQLIGMGHEVLVEPLLQVKILPIDPQEIDLEEAQALVATSRNGLRAAAQSGLFTAMVRLPIYVVGPGTASTAQALGFTDVRPGPRDARGLIGFIADHGHVNGGSLIYLAGERKAVDLGGELRRLGFHVQEPVVYSATSAARLSSSVVARFERSEIDGVLLLSPQTAATYARLIVQHRLDDRIGGVVHYCLSRAVADRLARLGEPKVLAASQPDLKSLLTLVAQSVSNLP